MNIIVTGGAGFIGSAVVRHLIAHTAHRVMVIDKLSYAGDMASLSSVEAADNFQFLRSDINDTELIHRAFAEFKPDAVMHLAAETHVDNSIASPEVFMHSNMLGTFNLLEVCRDWQAQHPGFRFLQVSTDEVFGDLMGNGSFSERSPYRPSSPYSASKAAADHLVRAWARTYDLPVVIAHCSNNYGPYQHEEKLIPTVIRRALAGEAIPVYGNGEQVRDWIYVEDCAGALVTILEKGTSGESYNVGGCNERRNIDVIHMLCAKLDALCAKENGEAYAEQIRFVTDRPGHDQRYALDCTKLRESLGWSASVDFEAGITATVRWYCAD